MSIADRDQRVAHGGALADACRSFGGQPADWLDLSTGINPNPVTIPAIDPAAWQRLPDDDLVARASAAAASYYRTADRVLPLPVAGTQSVIQVLPALFSGPVAVLGPTYGEYRFRFQRAGLPVEVVSGLEQVGARHHLVILVNPNNPDGRVLSRESIIETAARLDRHGGFMVVDEAFADAGPGQSVADQAGRQANLVVLRSFGKFFGLAGLRLGFVIATGRLLRRIRVEQGPWAVSGPALALAAEVLGDAAASEVLRQRILERRRALGGLLSGQGLHIAGGTGLFALVSAERAADLHQALCARRILTRRFDYRPDWLRFGLTASADDDARLDSALAEIMPVLR